MHNQPVVVDANPLQVEKANMARTPAKVWTKPTLNKYTVKVIDANKKAIKHTEEAANKLTYTYNTPQKNSK